VHCTEIHQAAARRAADEPCKTGSPIRRPVKSPASAVAPILSY